MSGAWDDGGPAVDEDEEVQYLAAVWWKDEVQYARRSGQALTVTYDTALRWARIIVEHAGEVDAEPVAFADDPTAPEVFDGCAR